MQIDAAGRVVLPKPVRKRFNLAAGDQLRVVVDAGGVRLEPVQPSGHLVRKGKVVVFRGEFDRPITPELVNALVDEDRARDFGDPTRKPRKQR